MAHAVQGVPWRDLTQLTRKQTIVELLLPLPWLAASLFLAGTGWWPLAFPCSFVFFNAGLRLAHGAFHRTIGLSARGCDAVIFGLSAIMLGSNHAVRHTHLQHHRHCLKEHDIEGAYAQRWFSGRYRN